MTIKNADLYQIRSKFNELKSLQGIRLVMALARNKELIEAEIKVLEAIKEDTPEYKDFKNEYLEMRKKYADKDEKGEPLLEVVPHTQNQTTYKVTKKEKSFQKSEATFLEKHKELLNLMDGKIKDYNEALNNNCSIKFHMVKEDDIPKTVTYGQFDAIKFMVDMKL